MPDEYCTSLPEFGKSLAVLGTVVMVPFWSILCVIVVLISHHQVVTAGPPRRM